LSPHLQTTFIHHCPEERDDFFPCSSTESSEDDHESVEDSDSDESTLCLADPNIANLVVGLDISGLDNENGCCHLNSVIIVLFSCRLFRRFFGSHGEHPPIEDEIWHNLIELRSQMGTFVIQSTLELQFVLSQTLEFSGYFEKWQNACDTFEQIIHLRFQTEFGADLISLTSVTTLIHTRHVCSEDSYVSAIEEGYVVISESELIESYGTQSFSEFLRVSTEKEGRSFQSCPCCHEVSFVNELVAVPSVLIVRIIRDWTGDGRDVRFRNASIPVDFHFDKCDRDYRLSVATCVQRSAASNSHYYAIVRSESNDWYLYDDSHIKIISNSKEVQELTGTIYFCLFE
jgi:hypothetical protein